MACRVEARPSPLNYLQKRQGTRLAGKTAATPADPGAFEFNTKYQNWPERT
jgi:hypothetical protein